MHKSSNVIITDTSCFSLLRKLDALNILNDLFAGVITTPEIAAEFKFPLPTWVKIIEVENKASAIALAAEINYNYLILDDADARRFAEKIGLRVIGTIGLLVIAKNEGLIPLLKPYFDKIQQTNFRISSSLLERVLSAAGE
jgi:predicted nucleic acid-binding protein